MTATSHRVGVPPNYKVTRYQVGDLVLRMYPSSMARAGAPNKLGSFWQGPFRITEAYGDEECGDTYTIENLVTKMTTRTHVSQLKPFIYDPNYVIPLDVAVRDTEEYIVGDIIEHRPDGQGSYI